MTNNPQEDTYVLVATYYDEEDNVASQEFVEYANYIEAERKEQEIINAHEISQRDSSYPRMRLETWINKV